MMTIVYVASGKNSFYLLSRLDKRRNAACPEVQNKMQCGLANLVIT